jgi:twitching motility two-component system response regulator PilH
MIMSTVLLVEDSLSTRKMISELLIKQGMKVEIAVDGVEALEILPTIKPDLVVLDIVMPKMNGYEVCRNIKSNPKTKNVPVLICSSKGEDFDRYWGMKQGADAYIAKPFQPKELIATIKQLLKTSN